MQASGSGRHRVKRLVRRNWRDVAEGAARAAVDAVRQAEAEALASHGLVNRTLDRVRAVERLGAIEDQ